MDSIYNVINLFFGINKKELDKENINQIYYIYVLILIIIKETILNKFNDIAELNKNEYKGSCFDEYDKKEGYDEEEKIDTLNYYLDALNYIYFYANRVCKTSIKDCMDMNLKELLDYVYFSMKYDKEHKEDYKEN